MWRSAGTKADKPRTHPTRLATPAQKRRLNPCSALQLPYDGFWLQRRTAYTAARNFKQSRRLKMLPQPHTLWTDLLTTTTVHTETRLLYIPVTKQPYQTPWGQSPPLPENTHRTYVNTSTTTIARRYIRNQPTAPHLCANQGWQKSNALSAIHLTPPDSK